MTPVATSVGREPAQVVSDHTRRNSGSAKGTIGVIGFVERFRNAAFSAMWPSRDLATGTGDKSCMAGRARPSGHQAIDSQVLPRYRA